MNEHTAIAHALSHCLISFYPFLVMLTMHFCLISEINTAVHLPGPSGPHPPSPSSSGSSSSGSGGSSGGSSSGSSSTSTTSNNHTNNPGGAWGAFKCWVGMTESCQGQAIDTGINNNAEGGEEEEVLDIYGGGGANGAGAGSDASLWGIIGMAVGGVVLVAAVAGFILGKVSRFGSGWVSCCTFLAWNFN